MFAQLLTGVNNQKIIHQGLLQNCLTAIETVRRYIIRKLNFKFDIDIYIDLYNNIRN